MALQLVGNITFQHFWPVRGSQAMFVVSTGQEHVTNLQCGKTAPLRMSELDKYKSMANF